MTTHIPVAVLAATGAVGQRFVSLLADHPWFEVAVITASPRSVGKRYADAARWVVPGDVPPDVASMTLVETTPQTLAGVQLVFSALPSPVARTLEPELAAAGLAVCSNASAHRMAADVPLLIPEINPDHVDLIRAQRALRGWDGFLATSPNCATTAAIFPLAALQRAFGLRRAHVVTLQAVSGAGYPGVPSLDILDNVIPFIDGEEDKIEHEPRKLLGTLLEDHVELAEVAISAQVHRVPIRDGHLTALSVELEKPASQEEIDSALVNFTAPAEVRDLPSSPAHPLILRTEPDRPQPLRDRDAENGMAVTVGRVQPCAALGVKLVSVAHNTIRGAAGGAILNAEWLMKSGLLEV